MILCVERSSEVIVLGTDRKRVAGARLGEAMEAFRDTQRSMYIWLIRNTSVTNPPIFGTSTGVPLEGPAPFRWTWQGTDHLTLGDFETRVPAYRLVFMGVDSDQEMELNAWYDEEHLPGLVSVPGVRWATRYREYPSGSSYLAIYAVDSLKVCESAEWKAVGNTPWRDSVQKVIRTRYRVDCVLGTGTSRRDDHFPAR
jgi:hypothetical protein